MRQLLFSLMMFGVFSILLNGCAGSSTSNNAIPSNNSNDNSIFDDVEDGAGGAADNADDDVADNADDVADNADDIADNADDAIIDANNNHNDIVFIGNNHVVAMNAFEEIATDDALQQSTSIQLPDSLGSAVSTEFTVQGLVVQTNDNTEYQRGGATTDWADTENTNTTRNINLARITMPSVSLVFDEDGAISDLTIYMEDKTYVADMATNDFTSIIDKNGDAVYTGTTTSKFIDVDTSDIFGFASDYMSYISWNLDKTNLASDATTDNVYAIDGMMLTGIETQAIPTKGAIAFNGSGKGSYGNINTSYATRFNVTANVDFADSIIGLEVKDTACTNCDDVDVTGLNFTLIGDDALTYSDGVNNISSAVTVGDLSGTLDARFYGSLAKELGGTFALNNSESYYYGAFGSYYESDISVETIATNHIDIEVMVLPTLPYDNFKLASDAGVQSSFNLSGAGVMLESRRDYSRSETDIETQTSWADSQTKTVTEPATTITTSDNAVMSVTFDDDGYIADATMYFGDAKYQTGDENAPASEGYHKTDIADSDSNVSSHFVVSRNLGIMGDYMIYSDWGITKIAENLDDNQITDETYTISGYAVAGIATDIEDMPSDSGIVIFQGFGSGIYQKGKDNVEEVFFRTRGKVDFAENSAELYTNETCAELSPFTCAAEKDRSELNFTTGKINYASDSTEIIADITADDTMQGKIEARFYGPDAEEIGGTFFMQDVIDSTRKYIGVFGAGKP
ncbi:MAG: transferrin-binding protein-like solute binding protein [Alphaproteobacteria bacterium]|nr:transferrin-binding protein-like solute binding protein [Alphaproteobacteria bacterium]